MSKTEYLNGRLSALTGRLPTVTAQLGRDYQYNPKAFTAPKWSGLKTAKDRTVRY